MTLATQVSVLVLLPRLQVCATARSAPGSIVIAVVAAAARPITPIAYR
ncbi:MAG TPA: hypothetical protein VN709_08810 [Terriglobales bacterium]|nr:hypothetical protein [Terriglobales bacterium]